MHSSLSIFSHRRISIKVNLGLRLETHNTPPDCNRNTKNFQATQWKRRDIYPAGPS